MSYESDRPLDYDELRARALKRIAPQMHVRRLRLLFLLNVFAFVVVNLLGFSVSGSPFLEMLQRTAQDFNGTSFTYTYPQPYPLAIAFAAGWFIFLIGQFLWVQMVAGREKLVPREMEREIELERKRLDLELLRAHAGPAGDEPEKAKRMIRLSDDGELLSDISDGRRAERRRGSG